VACATVTTEAMSQPSTIIRSADGTQKYSLIGGDHGFTTLLDFTNEVQTKKAHTWQYHNDILMSTRLFCGN
jgi:hypothetical protein